MSSVERRKFMFGAAATGALFMLGSCNFIEGFPPADSKKQTAKEISSLSSSYLKDLLAARVLPYFQQQTPFVLDRSGFKLRVHDVSVHYDQVLGGGYAGLLYLRGNRAPEAYFFEDNTHIESVYPFLYTEEELKRFPTGVLPDGTPHFSQQYNSGRNIYEGISPEIRLSYHDMRGKSEQEIVNEKVAVSFLTIKEASSLLLYDILAEETYLGLLRNNFPVRATVNVGSVPRTTKEIEIVNTMLVRNYENAGRLQAALDLGGMIVALKVNEKLLVVDYLARRFGWDRAVSELPGVDLGTTPVDVLKNSFRWAITSPSTSYLIYAGSLNKIP